MLENKLDGIWNVKYIIKWNKIFEGTIFCTKAHNFVLTKVNTNRFFFCSFLKFHSCKVLQNSLFCCVYLKTFSHLFCDHFWNSLTHGLKKIRKHFFRCFFLYRFIFKWFVFGRIFFNMLFYWKKFHKWLLNLLLTCFFKIFIK